MKIIWKYIVPVKDEFSIRMPEHHKILSFQTQCGTPTLWVLVDPDTPLVEVKFNLYGTGNPMGFFGNYIGTTQTYDGALVWHLFEA